VGKKARRIHENHGETITRIDRIPPRFIDPSNQINSCNPFFWVFTSRAELTKRYDVGGLNASDEPCDSIQLWWYFGSSMGSACFAT
jgi:hypothetical protein